MGEEPQKFYPLEFSLETDNELGPFVEAWWPWCYPVYAGWSSYVVLPHPVETLE